MTIDPLLRQAILDGIEGYELVQFLDIPIEDVLFACLDNDWISEEQELELRDDLGLFREGDEDDVR